MGLNKVIVASGIVLAVSALVGCGSSSGGLLSRDQASRLQADLRRAQDALSAGRCEEAASAARDLVTSAQGLGGVDSTLVSNLVQGANTVMHLTVRDCQAPAPRLSPPPKTTVTHTQTTATTQGTTPSTTPPASTQTTSTVTPPLTTSTTGGGSLNTTTAPATPTSPATTPATTPTSTPAGTTPGATSTSGGAGLQGPAGGG